MSTETLSDSPVPVCFLLVFLIPALFWDSLILQVSSDLIRRSIADWAVCDRHLFMADPGLVCHALY